MQGRKEVSPLPATSIVWGQTGLGSDRADRVKGSSSLAFASLHSLPGLIGAGLPQRNPLKSWKYLVLDVEQQTAADKVGRSKRPTPWPRRWFIEAYVEAYEGVKLVIAVFIRGEPTYFVAVIIGTGIESDRISLAPPADALETHNGHQQLPMLIDYVKPMEDGKLMVLGLWSLVRLHFIKDFPENFRDTRIDLGAGTAPAVSRRRRFQDREGRSRARRPAGRYYQLPGEVVQGNAKVMNDITDDRA